MLGGKPFSWIECAGAHNDNSASDHRIIRIAAGVLSIFVSIVVLTAGLDNILVHDGWGLLVFVIVIAGVKTIINVADRKILLRKK